MIGCVGHTHKWIQWGPPKKKENTIADNIISCDGIGGLFRAIKLSTGRAHLTCSWSYSWKGLQWISIILSNANAWRFASFLLSYNNATHHLSHANLPPSLPPCFHRLLSLYLVGNSCPNNLGVVTHASSASVDSWGYCRAPTDLLCSWGSWSMDPCPRD
jgi:hypothetical protein